MNKSKETKETAAKAVKETTKKVKETTKATATAVKAKTKAAQEELTEKAAAKKKTAKKTAETKTAAKKTTKKSVKASVELQFAGKSFSYDELVQDAQNVWQYDMGRKASEIKSLSIYVKPEESMAYFVVNETEQGSFAL